MQESAAPLKVTDKYVTDLCGKNVDTQHAPECSAPVYGSAQNYVRSAAHHLRAREINPEGDAQCR